MAIQTPPIPVKIQCGCGQKYAFDVQPTFAGRMPAPVTCPICGADGTTAANTVLAQHFPTAASAPAARIPSIPVAASSTAPPAAPVAQRVAVASAAPVATVSTAPAHVPTERPRLPGQLDHEQAKREARSKIMWGDDPADVSKFLMGHGMSPQDAQAIIAPLLNERKESVRKAGFNKIFTGVGMMCVPVVAWFFFLSIGYMPLKLMGLAGAVGLWGAYRALGGVMMVMAPKGEKGDVAEM